MGEIIESRRRHYVGLDADKDTIPAGGKDKGDSYHANDKGKQYYWDGANWKTGLGYEFVPTPKAVVDWVIGDITDDGGWHNDALDLATKGVVAGAKAVALALIARSTGASDECLVRTDVGDGGSIFDAYSPAANILFAVNIVMPISADLLLDYNVAANFNVWNLTVLGYFI